MRVVIKHRLELVECLEIGDRFINPDDSGEYEVTTVDISGIRAVSTMDSTKILRSVKQGIVVLKYLSYE